MALECKEKEFGIGEKMKKEAMVLDFSKLKWFDDSPFAGDPDCICSYCGEVISEGECPIRIWNGKKPIKEIRLHWGCFLQVRK